MSTEAVVPQIEQPKVFKARREVPLKDEKGNTIGGKQVYEAEGLTQQEADQKLADKMADAILHGTRKIRELNLKVKNGGIEAPKAPEGAELDDFEIPEPKPRQLTETERFQLSQDLKDPAKMEEAYDKLYEARTGLKPQDDAKVRTKSAIELATTLAIKETEIFTQENPEFYTCEKNRQAMVDYMSSRKMKWNRKNLVLAFKELKADGLLDEAPPVISVEPQPEPPRTEARTERQPDRFPSSIRPSQASGADTRPKPKGPSAKEVAMMNPAELKKHYESQGLWGK